MERVFPTAHTPAEFLKTLFSSGEDPRVPSGAKLLLAGIVAYLLWPVDLMPDFLPVMGQLDDLAVVLGGLKLFLRLCPAEVVQQHVRSIAAGK